MLIRIIKLIAFIVSLFVLVLFSLEFFVSIYKFPETRVFSGNKLYNPYDSIDRNNWKIGNFHAHTKSWLGLTNGKNVTPKEADSVYDKLGYKIYQISDYQKINKFNDTLVSYIQTYEHGYSIPKNHHLCIGAKSVVWLDFPFYQSIHHKQTMLDKLNENNDITAIAHPLFNKAFSPDDFNILSNYNLIEVFNHYAESTPCWDSALSSGHPVFIIADDDMHDLSNPDEVGVCCNFINVEKPEKSQIINALKSGHSYGVSLPFTEKDNIDIKAQRIKSLPYLVYEFIRNDTIFVKFSDTLASLRFVGQNGRLLKIKRNTDKSLIKIKPSDSYIRVEAICQDSTKIYLNPVFRYTGINPLENLKPQKKIFLSILPKLFIIALWIWLIYLLFIRKKYARKKSGRTKL